jgi:hypothetical protein
MGRSVADLLHDYREALKRSMDMPRAMRERLAAQQRFMEKIGHHLQRFPAALPSLWAAQPGGGPAVLTGTLGSWSGPWFRLLNPPTDDPFPGLLFTQDAQQGGVNAIALWQGVDGKTVYALSGGDDGTLHYWSWSERRRLRVLKGHTAKVAAVAVAADGRHALSGSADYTLRGWDLDSGQSLELRGHTDWVNAVALAADGRHALSGGWDHTLRWWDLDSGRARVLRGHTGPINTVVLAADSRHALSGSRDKTLRWWDLDSGRARELRRHTGGIKAVALSSDGRHALSGSGDKTAALVGPGKRPGARIPRPHPRGQCGCAVVGWAPRSLCQRR